MIHKKMIAIMQDIGAIGKNDRNKQQGFAFRGIDAVYNDLHYAMGKQGVYSMPEVLETWHEERKTKSGGNLIYRILKIKYTFYAEDGSLTTCTVIGEGMDSGDKAASKAMAIAHKYALVQAFCIPTKELKDPDFDTAPPSTRKTPPATESVDNQVDSDYGSVFLECSNESEVIAKFKQIWDGGVSHDEQPVLIDAKNERIKEVKNG